MKIVIQCAARKDPAAGHFRSQDGTAVKFVAHPELVVGDFAGLLDLPDNRPDGSAKSWRDLLKEYNKDRNGNPFGLFPAWRLYLNPAYNNVIARFGEPSVYILSAGWGLIRSDYLIPQYDITFSASADPINRRKSKDQYLDFCQLTANEGDHVVFFGGKSYLPLFCRLTEKSKAERIIYYNSQSVPHTPGCRLIRYETKMRTNWHYACANDFASGKLKL